MKKRHVLVIAGLLALNLVFAFAALAIGSSDLAVYRIWHGIFGAEDKTAALIVRDLRLPRVLLALLAGAGLGFAGAILQRVTRNPLAEPTVLGFVSGAALGVLLFLYLFSDDSNSLQVPVHWQPVAASMGAFTAALCVYLLSSNDEITPLRLLLYGVAIAAAAQALVTLMIVAGPVHRSSQALIWLAGSVHEAAWRDVYWIGLAFILFCPLALFICRGIDQLQLDDQSAFSTGANVTFIRLGALCICVVFTAATVSVVGGIGFVGLVAPHAARLLLGSGSIQFLSGSAALGALIVLTSDMLVRIAFEPLEVPTGAVTALIGAPYLIFLLIREGRIGAR